MGEALTVQSGYGQSGGITVDEINLGSSTVGDGTFTDGGQSYGTAGGPTELAAADFNGDGEIDIVTAD